MSVYSYDSAVTALSTGVIIAIVVPCVIVGIAIIIGISICIYCLCCRKSKVQPGMVLQQPGQQGPGGYNNQPPQGGYNSQPPRQV